MDPLLFHNKITSFNMEYLRVVRQIQNAPEKVTLQRKQTLTEFPDKKLNKSRIVLIKAKLAYRSPPPVFKIMTLSFKNYR